MSRSNIAATLLLLAAAWATPAGAQLSFPTSVEDYEHFYVTAYYDHGGVTDWNCGSNSYSGHGGNDFGGGGFVGMEEGRDIVAAAPGEVVAVNDGEFDECTTGDCPGGGGFGNYVRVEHGDGNQVIYAHMAQWSVAVAVGDFVTCGQLLGLMGSSGYSTGPHLHFELRDADWNRFDPFAGDCSDTPASLWTEQGAYEALPGLTCPGEECTPDALLTCGDELTMSNDGPGSTQATWFYGCTEWYYSGPELSWWFVTDLDESVEVTLTGLAADLDLYAVESTACAGDDCLAGSDNSDSSDESITFDAVAAEQVVLVVDGYEGAVSEFTLSVHCDGGLPAGDPDGGAADGGADGDADADGDVDADGDADTDDQGAGGGGGDDSCGCRVAGAPGGGLLALLVQLL